MQHPTIEQPEHLYDWLDDVRRRMQLGLATASEQSDWISGHAVRYLSDSELAFCARDRALRTPATIREISYRRLQRRLAQLPRPAGAPTGQLVQPAGAGAGWGPLETTLVRSAAASAVHAGATARPGLWRRIGAVLTGRRHR